MMYPLDIGAGLVETRRGSGMTQAQLGAILGVSQPQIARWEASEYRNASLHRVDAVARALERPGTLMERPEVAAGPPAPYEPTPLPAAAIEKKGPLARLGVDKATISEFCVKHRITELAVSGAVLESGFEQDSDVDILVRFTARRDPDFLEILDITQELGEVFGRPIDLIDRTLLENSRDQERRERLLLNVKTLYSRDA